MSDALHPLAPHHLPPFITPPGETDVLMNVMIVVVIAIILAVGTLYLRLHALPEHMAHRGHKVQFEIVAVLALLALFTHNHLFWIAGLLLALVQIPDFSTPLASMAESQERIARRLVPAMEPAEARETIAHPSAPATEPAASPETAARPLAPATEPAASQQKPARRLAPAMDPAEAQPRTARRPVSATEPEERSAAAPREERV